MQQMYLVSVVLNLLGGLLLLAPRVKDESVRTLVQKPGVRATVAVLAIIAGVAKLILRAPSDHVPIVGDLLPALAGIAVGAVLLGDAQASGKDAVEPAGWFRRNAPVLRVPVAIAGIAAAVAHFIFPGAVIL
jgi:hypothetical protein